MPVDAPVMTIKDDICVRSPSLCHAQFGYGQFTEVSLVCRARYPSLAARAYMEGRHWPVCRGHAQAEKPAYESQARIRLRS